MMEELSQLADLILEIERQLRLLDLWSDEVPSEARLSSQEPFAIDTLSFNEWLQFLFIPRMKVILEQAGGLPVQSNISPMAEEYFKSNDKAANLIKAIQEFDQVINSRS